MGPAWTINLLNRVLPNLDARYPVYLAISGDGSHAVVCDGYGYNLGTLFHHLNMGWSGSYDAWYNLPNVDAGYHFTSVDAYYYNIYPAGTGEIISGRVTDPGGAPLVSASIQAVAGGQTYLAQTDSRGIFALPKLPSDTTFTVTATKAGYQFAPWVVATGQSDDYGSSGNQWAVNFVGTQNSGVRIVCGSVTNSTGIGVSGVTISFSNGGGNVATDSSGRFFNTVPAGVVWNRDPGENPVRLYSRVAVVHECHHEPWQQGGFWARWWYMSGSRRPARTTDLPGRTPLPI